MTYQQRNIKICRWNVLKNGMVIPVFRTQDQAETAINSVT